MFKTLLYLLGIGAIYYYYVENKGQAQQALTNVGVQGNMPGFISASPSTQNPVSIPQASRADANSGTLNNQPWYSGPQITTSAASITTVVSNSFTGLKDLWTLISSVHNTGSTQLVPAPPAGQPIGAATASTVAASAGQPVAAQVLVGSA